MALERALAQGTFARPQSPPLYLCDQRSAAAGVSNDNRTCIPPTRGATSRRSACPTSRARCLRAVNQGLSPAFANFWENERLEPRASGHARQEVSNREVNPPGGAEETYERCSCGTGPVVLLLGVSTVYYALNCSRCLEVLGQRFGFQAFVRQQSLMQARMEALAGSSGLGGDAGRPGG